MSLPAPNLESESLDDEEIRELLGGPWDHVKSGRDLVEYWRSEGLIGSRSDIDDAQEEARRLRREAERRSG